MPFTTTTPPVPCTLVIFGATGDLTARKLLPALFALDLEGRLPTPFTVVGIGRRPWTSEEFRRRMQESLHAHARHRDAAAWSRFAERLTYFEMDFHDAGAYPNLRAHLQAHCDTGNSAHHAFYLATAPEAFSQIVENLAAAGLAKKGAAWPRLLIEKPFGHDLASAAALNAVLRRAFAEPQIFRIDHYLGKEIVQSLLALRFTNGLFESQWNSAHIDHVQITVAEAGGVEGRGPYYESAGALRDVAQNHLLQLLTLVAMEPPVTLDADAVREEKIKVLKSLQPLSPAQVREQVVRGQYGPGAIEGHHARGYREEERVDPASATETFAALRLTLRTWRWAGTPFYLRTGKRLPASAVEIVLKFKDAPHVLFYDLPRAHIGPNLLRIRVQPQEGISLQFNTKAPGLAAAFQPVTMHFSHAAEFGPNTPEAYERLLHDMMAGDPTLFSAWEEVELAWRFIDSIGRAWAESPHRFPNYAAGTWGPKDAEDLIRRDGREWINSEDAR